MIEIKNSYKHIDNIIIIMKIINLVTYFWDICWGFFRKLFLWHIVYVLLSLEPKHFYYHTAMEVESIKLILIKSCQRYCADKHSKKIELTNSSKLVHFPQSSAPSTLYYIFLHFPSWKLKIFIKYRYIAQKVWSYFENIIMYKKL